MEILPQEYVPPDGGWGWMVVAGVVLTNTFIQSIGSVFGLLFGEHLQSMNHETVGAAIISNLNGLAINFSGFLIGPAIKNYSPRRVICFGTILVSLGLICCAFSTKLWHIILSYSLPVGIGQGLISASTFMAINSYFTSKRGRAVGIALAGTGFGQMLMPHVVRVCLDAYGFRTTILVLGALALHGFVGASLFQPVQRHMVRKRMSNLKEIKLLLETKPREKNLSVTEANSTQINTQNKKPTSTCSKILKKITEAWDLELLKDSTFWSICVGMGFVYTANTNFSMLYPYFLQESAFLTRTHTATCMSVLAGADLISRLLLPILTDKMNVPYRVVFLSGSCGLFIVRTILAELSDFYILIAMSFLYGAVKAATIVNSNLTISSYCKPEKLAGGLGLNMICRGVLLVFLGQLLGWVRDYSGSYPFCIHMQNLLLLAVVIVWTPEIIYNYIKRRKTQSDIRSNSILKC